MERIIYNLDINKKPCKINILQGFLWSRRVIDIDEHSWWFKWKQKKIEENSKDTNFIKLVNGNELIDLLKENDLYNQIFKIDDSLKIAEIYNAVVPKKIEISNEANPKVVLLLS